MRRDRLAADRDESALLDERSVDQTSSAVLRDRSAQFRAGAAADRAAASLDREAGARDRGQAGRDRLASRADRDAGGTERSTSGEDRTEASADRSAAAEQRASSSIDELTTAYVRAAGLRELDREVARATRSGEPLTLAFVDVDRLKAINDERGHAAGDRVLAAVVHAIRAVVRSHDLIVRYGGDEFLCVFAGLDGDGAARRLAGVNALLSAGEHRASVTSGIAAMTSGDTAASLIARADADLYAQRTQTPPPAR